MKREPANLYEAVIALNDFNQAEAQRGAEIARKEAEFVRMVQDRQAAMQPAQTQIEGLFAAFVQYIDRGEKTTRAYLNNLKQFACWLKYQGIQQPGRQDVIAYRDWLLMEHDAIELDASAPEGWRYRTDHSGTPQRIACKPNTAKLYLQSVKQFFSWTAAEGLYPNVAANVHTPKVTDTHRKDSLTALEVQTIESAIREGAEAAQATAAAAKKDTAGRQQRSTEQGKRLFAMYQLAVNAGLRTIELTRANIRDIEVKNGAASLLVWGKGHAEPDARKPLAPAVYQAIRDYLDSRTDKPTGASPLFVSTGNRSRGKRIASTTISTMLKRAMQAAGFDSDRLTAHSLRHTAGQNVMEITGDNLFQTQMYMRHSNPKTTEIYLNQQDTAQDARIAERLFEHYHGNQGGRTAGKLEAAIDKLTAAQREQLAAIAEAMATR